MAASLKRRVDSLEEMEPQSDCGAVVMYAPSLLSEEEAVAEHQAKHGPIEGGALFIKLVGVKPDEQSYRS